jgi:hypothetical protein
MSRVVIADLLHHSSRDISSAVERPYKREVNQDPRVIVNPPGIAFSPDGLRSNRNGPNLLLGQLTGGGAQTRQEGRYAMVDGRV